MSQSAISRIRIRFFKEVTRADLEIFLKIIFLAANIRGRGPLFIIGREIICIPISQFFATPCQGTGSSTYRVLCNFQESRDWAETARSVAQNPTTGRLLSRELHSPWKNLCLESMWLGPAKLYPQNAKDESHEYKLKLFALTEPNGIVLRNLSCWDSQRSATSVVRTEKVVSRLLKDIFTLGFLLQCKHNRAFGDAIVVRQNLLDGYSKVRQEN